MVVRNFLKVPIPDPVFLEVAFLSLLLRCSIATAPA